MSEFEKSKKVGYYLERATRIVKRRFLQEFNQAGIDVTTEQWVILDNLYNRGDQSQKELAEISFKNEPTVSRIIDLLCKKGLTERQRFENDRRRYKISITETGKSLVEKFLPTATQIREQGWVHLSESDYERLISILDQIYENYK